MKQILKLAGEKEIYEKIKSLGKRTVQPQKSKNDYIPRTDHEAELTCATIPSMQMGTFHDFNHRRGASGPLEMPSEYWQFNNEKFAPSFDDSSISQRRTERDRIDELFPPEARAEVFNNGNHVAKEGHAISREQSPSLRTERQYGDAINYNNNSTELNVGNWEFDEDEISLLKALEGPANTGESVFANDMEHQASTIGSRPSHRRAASDSLAFQQDFFSMEYSNGLSAIADESVREQNIGSPMLRDLPASLKNSPMPMHGTNSFSRLEQPDNEMSGDGIFHHPYSNQQGNHTLKEVKQEPSMSDEDIPVKARIDSQRNPIMFQRGKLTTSRTSQSVTNRQIQLAEAYADLTKSGAECMDGDAAVLLALASPAAKKADPTQLDAKKAKRIMANRQSAYRSRMRRLQYIAGLEKNVKSLEEDINQLKVEYGRIEKSVQEKEAESKQLESQLRNAHNLGSNHCSNGDYDLGFCNDVVTNMDIQ